MPASPIEVRMAHLEGAYEQVSQRLTSIDLRLDGLDRKIDLFRDSLDAKIDKRFMWTVGVVVTTWLTTIGTIVASVYLRH
jgi:hypothetical protein